jgi:IclR family acetate operon transcriptional repressor
MTPIPKVLAHGVPASPESHERRIASVAKALSVLIFVAQQEMPVTAKEISAHMGQPLPTSYHMLGTLVAEGALVKGRDRGYRLGPRIGILSDAYREQGEPTDALLPALRELAESTGETAYLSTWRDGEIEVVATAEGSHAVRVGGLKRGAYGHAHARASGKLLLALARTTQRERYLAGHAMEALTPSTITDRAVLEMELDAIRERGFSFEEEEFTLGVCCVATPVIVSDRVIGAFTVSCPRDRFDDTKRSLLRTLRSVTTLAETAVLHG